MRAFVVHCMAAVTLISVGLTEARTREYFLAANEVHYDYAPGWPYLNNLDDPQEAEKYLKNGPDRIGSVYKKAIYFEYTDATFTTQKPKPARLGLLGPVIKAEVGDVITIHFFNNASRPYSVHPHGVFYLKRSEGALYLDNTSGNLKDDDHVPPGETLIAEWRVEESDAPTEDDPPCLPWVYHSHVNSVKDVFSGLFGLIITCKPGVLDNNNERTDVDEEFPLVDMNWDENMSWYLDDNINTFCQDPGLCGQLNANSDPDFIDSNLKRSLNGRSFGTLAGITVCVGDRVQFYVIGFGNEMDVHSLHFHGQNLNFQHQRGDTVSVYSATFVAVQTTPTVVGTWRITDMVGEYQKQGTSALYQVRECYKYRPKRKDSKNARRYYLAAEENNWNYAPSGLDLKTGTPLTGTSSQAGDTTTDPNNKNLKGQVTQAVDKGYMTGFLAWHRIHEQSIPSAYHTNGACMTYKKARFVQYKSQAFRARVPQTRQDEHLGILGPVLKAELGDRLVVTLKNTITFPVSFLPHGLSYDVTQEATDGPGVSGGSVQPNPVYTYTFDVPENLLDDTKLLYGPGVSGGSVQPNQVYTYTFDVPENVLDDTKLPCKSFLYTSAHDPTRDHITGLVGPLLVCRKGYLDSGESKPREFFLLLSIIDEDKSLYTPPNVTSGSDAMATNMKFGINGFVYGNLPGLSVTVGEDIVWYVMSLGSVIDVHTATFDGNTFTEEGTRRDGRSLVPGVTATLSMRPDNVGRWMVYSDSTFARSNGMFAFYTVSESADARRGGPKNNGKILDYYISAEEVLWNYAPLTRTIVTGENLTDPNVDGSIFVRHDDLFIGHIYKKVIYRGYTDATFSHPIESSRDILGPALIAEVGDTIRVTFRNNASRPYSIHCHGVQTSQDTSGLDYGSASPVGPGQTFVYIWKLPKRSGPGAKDPNCIPWLYSSYVDPVKDKNSGLVGALVVCRPGILDSYGRRKDVSRELYIYMSVLDENLSWYLDENVRMFAPGRVGTDYGSDPDFEESNKKHAINGRLYGNNNNNLVIEYGERIVWYMMVLGSQIDLHTIHLHGHTFIHSSEKHRDDVIHMFPGMAEAVEMCADNPGTWLLHCHVMDHIFAGMETVYTVLKPGEKLPAQNQTANQDYTFDTSPYRRK